MNLTEKHLSVLGQITQKGWGVSSMPNSVTCSLGDGIITLKYMTIVHFAAERALRDQVARINQESIQVLTKCAEDMKSTFKEETGDTLRLKETSNKDSLEMIVATNNSPRRVAYYRRQVTLRVV